MEEHLLKNGIKYIVKVGRNSIAVRLVQKNADGVSYLVKNLKTLKPFFVKSAKSFADFQNDGERQKALKIIEAENAPIGVLETSKLTKEAEASKLSNGSKISKTSKVSNEGKISKSPKIMGFGKCAFVKALGRLGYNYENAKTILDRFGVEMPEKSLRIQLYFGKNEKFWAKFGKPAELSEEHKLKIEKIAAFREDRIKDKFFT